MIASDLENWQKLKPWLDRLLDLPITERESFLDSLPGADAALRGDLKRMLDAALTEGNADPLARHLQPSVLAMSLAAHEEEGDRLGETVGRYRISRLLGAGGMGTVYVAARQEGDFAQDVALKIFKGSWLSPEVRLRFERERQILAKLRHPNIASLLDGGSTADGAPYYSMELVEGINIAEYCRAHVQSLEGRIALLLKVASALAYAHQQLIVHRDIKPSNILVSTDGHVKLLDFGIAKLVDDVDGETMTRADIGPMTPEYAAPEQFRGEPITVATDIYQLGTLCYQVLTGHLPFAADPKDRYAWSRAVSEDDPISAHAAITRPDGATWADASHVARLKRQLRGDLSAILGMALAKSPRQRYRSIDAFAADLEAYVAGRPVIARRAGTAYYAWRFLTRRPYVSIGAALAICAILVASVLALRQAQVASRESKSVLAVSASLISLMREADPDANGSAELTPKRLLDQSVKSIEKNLAEQPGPQAVLLTTAANRYIKLSELGRADAVLTEALADLGRLENPDPDAFTEAWVAMGWVRYRENKPQDALHALDEAALRLPPADGKLSRNDHLQWGSIWNYRGMIDADLGDYGDARVAFEKSLSVFEPDNGRATAQLNYVLTLEALDDYDRAMVEAEGATAEYLRLHGASHNRTAGAKVCVATLALEIGDIDKAKRIAEEIRPQYDKRFDDSDVQMYFAQLLYGNLARSEGRYDESLDHFRGATASLKGNLDAGHPYYATPLYYAGLVEYERGNDAAALENFQQTIDIRQKSLPPNHPDLAQALDARGQVLARLCRTSEARGDIERALAMREEKLPFQHSATVDSLRHAALLRFASGDAGGANALWAEASERAKSAYLYKKKPALMAALQTEMSDPKAAAAAFTCSSEARTGSDFR